MADAFSLGQRAVIDRVRAEGHRYVLRWIGEVSEADRDAFIEQLSQVDFDRLRELAGLVAAGAAQQAIGDLEPAPVIRLAASASERDADAVRLGAQALRDDRVAALTVAGGQGTRFKYRPPKGLYPVTPVLKKSLFQVHAEKILAARRRYGCRMPWLIMTNRFDIGETRGFFRANDFFGLGGDNVHLFQQTANLILDADGHMLMEEKAHLLMGPDGHGGVFEALGRSGLMPMLNEGGFDLLSYFQVDNPLVTIADERFLGHHLAEGSEFSCKVVPKREPGEGLGVSVLRDGKASIVEYSDLPAQIAEQRLPSGELKYLFGSIAVHVINSEFASRMSEGGLALPWHVARKQYDVIDEAGRRAPSQTEGCYKFERFVFDCMQHARACAFVEVDRGTEFAPIKRPEGPDSPATCRAMMRAMWLAWLREAGVDVSRIEDYPAAELEIGPLFATDAAELKAKLPAGWRPEPPVVLDEKP